MNSNEVAIRTLCRRCLYAITAFGYKKYKKGTMYLFAYRFSIMYTLYFTSVAILMKRCKILVLILLTLIFSSAAGCITSGGSEADTMLLTPEELRIPGSKVVEYPSDDIEETYVEVFDAKELLMYGIHDPEGNALGAFMISRYDINKIENVFEVMKYNLMSNHSRDPCYKELKIQGIGDNSYCFTTCGLENDVTNVTYICELVKNGYIAELLFFDCAYSYFQPYWDEDMEGILAILSQTIYNKI